jgi:hypothetical protein
MRGFGPKGLENRRKYLTIGKPAPGCSRCELPALHKGKNTANRFNTCCIGPAAYFVAVL